MFKGSFVALISPFKDGAVDAKGFQKFVDWQIKQGTHGLVPCGTTGESPTLSHDEHHAVVDWCIDQAKGRVPVIAGAGSNSTAEAIDLAKHAEKAGADAVLLIVAVLSERELQTLFAAASEAGLEALVEVHDEDELVRALALGARVLGVNCRDLKTMEVSLDTAVALAPLIPDEVVAVAESGIRTGADVRKLRDAGYDAFLVGERLMESPDPRAALEQLLADAGGGRG